MGVFYLGHKYDLEKGPSSELLLYDSQDLVTHAVCIGMTGSGKTGLGITLLEEAAMDGIPFIAIDPKGDLSNLLLTFPELRGEDFKPWVNADDARRQGKSIDDFATEQATLWQDGLLASAQDGARIARLLENCQFKVFTPGSTVAPVSILNCLDCPSADLMDDVDLLRERVVAATTCILALLGVESKGI